MAAKLTGQPLSPKTWQLDPPEKGILGHLYYCGLCDEALILTAREIPPRKIVLIFDNICPGCGFELENNLKRDHFKVPEGPALYANTRCPNPDILIEQRDPFTPNLVRGNRLTWNPSQSLTTGIEYFDRGLMLRKGQLVSLQGESSHGFSLLLCVRATLPNPVGLDGDSIFVDGGNMFDSYAVDQYATTIGLDSRKVHDRIHLSRAFTHHQLDSLITGLRVGIGRYNAKLVVVSDITQLYCDPDVKDVKESLNLFAKDVRLLRDLAEQTETIVLATILQPCNKRMEKVMFRTAHSSARIDGSQLTLEGRFQAPESELEAGENGLSLMEDENRGSRRQRARRRITAEIYREKETRGKV